VDGNSGLNGSNRGGGGGGGTGSGGGGKRTKRGRWGGVGGEGVLIRKMQLGTKKGIKKRGGDGGGGGAALMLSLEPQKATPKSGESEGVRESIGKKVEGKGRTARN